MKAAFRFIALITVVASTIALRANDLRVHEWGTFTTLHRPIRGEHVAWYQNPVFYAPKSGGNVSDLPAFIHGRGALKAMTKTTARMETPVVYFYTDTKRTVEFEVSYQGGTITEYFPGFPNQWKRLELIPPAFAGDLVKTLPVDSSRPDNHYYEARAVPKAAIVKVRQPDNEGKPVPDEVERFLFYRGMGTFDTLLNACLSTDQIVQIKNYNRNHGVKHIWIVNNSGAKLTWQKVASQPKHNPKSRDFPQYDIMSMPVRENPESELKKSMVDSLHDEGLTDDEARAMVATWDKQWYQEPGQRVFSIVDQKLIDETLPLKISPKPSATLRVFVHRQELLAPKTLTMLESAMSPGTDGKHAREMIKSARLGRFAQGAIESVAADIGRRTTLEYTMRGLEALKKPGNEVANVDRR